MSYQDKAAGLVRLQQIGWHKAILAGDILPGMAIVYNFGSVYDVLAVSRKADTLTIRVKDRKDGKEYDTRKRARTLTVAFWPKCKTV